jgi:hypothetical protein
MSTRLTKLLICLNNNVLYIIFKKKIYYILYSYMSGNPYQVTSSRLEELEENIRLIQEKKDTLLAGLSSQGQSETVFNSNSYITSKIIILLIAIISIIIVINYLIFR